MRIIPRLKCFIFKYGHCSLHDRVIEPWCEHVCPYFVCFRKATSSCSWYVIITWYVLNVAGYKSNVTAYIQKKLLYAGTANDQQTVWMS
jgi:hypothetical protein